MPQHTIDRLIINSPYEEPTKYWRYDRERRMFSLTEGRPDTSSSRKAPDRSMTRTISLKFFWFGELLLYPVE